MIRKYLYLLTLSSMLVSCGPPVPEEAYFNRGEPESLLDISSEVVNINLTSPASVQKVVDVLNKEQPTRARVSCLEGNPLCKEVKSVMNQFRVPVKYHSSKDNNVAIIYERILTRNCQNRFIDNLPNMNNLNMPTLGCSTALNMVQMVTDKHQFTDPALMDNMDAKKPMQAVTNYDTLTKPDATFPTMVESGTSSR